MASVCSRSFPSNFFVFLFIRIFDENNDVKKKKKKENNDVNGADTSFALHLGSHFCKRKGMHHTLLGPGSALCSSC